MSGAHETSSRTKSWRTAGWVGDAMHGLRKHPVWFTFLLALTVRIAAIVVLGEFSASLVLDDDTYLGMAEGKALGHDAGWEPRTVVLYNLTATLMVPLTLMYEVFGPTPIPGQVYLALAGAGVAALVARLLLEVTTTNYALVGGAITALLPSQIMWSTAVLKDALVWFMLVALALAVAVVNRSARLKLPGLGVVIAILLFLLAHLRLHTLVVASVALILASFFGIAQARLARVVMCVALGLLMPWIAGIGIGGFDLVTNAGSLEQRRLANAEGAQSAIVDADPDNELSAPEERFLQLITDPEKRVALEEAATEAGLSVAEARRLEERLEADPSLAIEAEDGEPPATPSTAEPSDTPDAPPLDPDLMHLPRGLSAMLLEPFPWQAATSTSFRFAQLESVIWYPVVALAALGIVPAFRHLRVSAFPFLAGGGILIMYALTEGNLGTAYRHRGEFVWAVIFLASLGLVWLRRGPATVSQQNPASHP